MPGLAAWALAEVACPRDGLALSARAGDALACDSGHEYPVVAGVPVLLLREWRQTHVEADISLAARAESDLAPVGTPAGTGGVDPFVQDQVGATCGRLYEPLIGRLEHYPIPELPLPDGGGRLFVEVGCNWGRWCVAASRRGWRVLGLDPSLRAILAARRVAAQLGVEASFVVADARALPLRADSVACVFSYSVLQHLEKAHVRRCLREIRRVLAPDGATLVQLPNALGLARRLAAARRRRRPTDFDVRDWTPDEIAATFARLIGPTTLRADGYFNLNPRPEDLRLLPWRYRPIVWVSELLRHGSAVVPALARRADSLWVTSRRDAPGGADPAAPRLRAGMP